MHLRRLPEGALRGLFDAPRAEDVLESGVEKLMEWIPCTSLIDPATLYLKL